MRLHRLSLRGYRGVEDRTLEFPESGVTVVVGDNESGKSSLLEALHLLFEMPDDSKAQKLRAIQPVGSDVATEVEAELRLGDNRVRYRKRWFSQRATELSVRAGGDSDQAARDQAARDLTGREAHDEASRLFGEHVDRTLWDTLVVAQAKSLWLPAPGEVAAVLTALDQAGGGAEDHGAAGPLREAVEREYSRYFTRTGRPTGEYSQAEEQHDAADRHAGESERRLAEVGSDVETAERLERDRRILADSLAEQQRVVAGLAQRKREAGELLGRADRLREQSAVAAERRSAAEEQLARRQALRDDADRQARRLEETSAEAETLETSLVAARAGFDRAAAACERSRKAHEERRAISTRLDDHVTGLRAERERAELDARIVAVEDARTREQEAQVGLETNGADADTLEAGEAAHRDVLVARQALEAGAPTLTVRRLGDTPVQLRSGVAHSGPTPTEDAAESWSEQTIVVEADTTVRADGVVELVVRPGDGAVALADAARRAERAEGEVLARVGVADIAALRARAREREEAEQTRSRARERLEELLDGGATTQEQLRVRRATLGAERDPRKAPGAVEGASDLTSGLAPDLPSDLETAEQERLAARRAEEAARRERDAADRDLDSARTAFDAAQSEAVTARVHLTQETERRDDLGTSLAKERIDCGDDELAARVEEVARHAETTADEVSAVEQELANTGADRAEEDVEQAILARDQLTDQLEQLRDEQRRVEGRLEAMGAQGLATVAERARVDLAHATEHREAVARRARAASRLRQTLEEHRSQARRRYAAPLRERVERFGRRLHGPTFGIVLGENLEVEQRELDGVRLPTAALSTGAREQLTILMRLAIAELTATGGVPVVLDDALGWSDPSRLRTMGALLGQAGTDAQIILLTCVPDRYARVPGAHVLRM